MSTDEHVRAFERALELGDLPTLRTLAPGILRLIGRTAHSGPPLLGLRTLVDCMIGPGETHERWVPGLRVRIEDDINHRVVRPMRHKTLRALAQGVLGDPIDIEDVRGPTRVVVAYRQQIDV